MAAFFWFLIIIIQLGALTGLIFLFRAVNSWLNQLESQRDSWLHQIRECNSQLKSLGRRLDRVENHLQIFQASRSIKTRVLWMILQKTLFGAHSSGNGHAGLSEISGKARTHIIKT